MGSAGDEGIRLAVSLVVREAGEAGDDAAGGVVFVLTEEMRAELREAAAAADRGELVDMEDVLGQVDWSCASEDEPGSR
jgi:predicted transcriptional regulator